MGREGAGTRDGFRQIPGDGLNRKVKQAMEKHVNQGDFQQFQMAVDKGFKATGRVINDSSVRIDAIQKALVESGVVKEATIKFNQQNLKIVQQFIVNDLGADTPFVDRVRAAVVFNATQAEDFRVTDEYWPVRNWLVSNPDEIEGEEMGIIAESFGFSESAAMKILADAATYKFAKAQPQG